MNIDDLMRQAGLDAIADKDSRAAAGQEMTSPEQDRYHAACYFAWLVSNAARVQAREEAAALCKAMKYEGYAPPEHGAAAEYYQEGAGDCYDAIRRMGEEAGRG